MSEQYDQQDREEIIRKLMIFRQIVAQTEAEERERTKAEEELWRTGSLSRALIENSPIGVSVCGPDGRMLLFNGAWLRIWGLTEARARELDRQAEGQTLLQRYSFLGHMADQAQKVFLEGGELFLPEVHLEGGSPGGADWASFHFYPINNDQGRVEQVVTLAQDISARKKAELELEAVRSRLEMLLHSSPAVIFSCRGEPGSEVAFISDNVRQVLGYYVGQWLSDPGFWQSRIHPEDRKAMAAPGAGGAANRARVREYRFLHSDGIYRWLYEESNRVEAAGGEAETVGYFIDITSRKWAEETLRDSEQRFRSLVQSLSDVVFTCHRGGTVTSLNPAFEALTGRPGDSLIGQPFVSLVHPIDAQSTERAMAACLRGQEVAPFEARVPAADGGLLTLEFRMASQLKDGEVAGVLGVARDITARKRAEQELRASEALNRAIIEHSPVGISVRSPTGKLLSYNRAWQEIWAMTDEDILQDLKTPRPELRFDPKDNYLGDWLPEVERIYRQGGTLFIPELSVSKPAFSGEKQIAQYFYALPGPEGGVDRVVVITQDLTERRQSLEEVTILARAVKGASECISITDEGNNLLFVNDAFCSTYGYRREELIGRHVGMLLPPSRAEEDEATVRRATLAGGWRGELVNRRRDGTEFPVYLSTSVVRDEQGRALALIGVARDITEQKAAEAQRERVRQALLQSSKLEAMGAMAGGVAHDFNNLLTVIQGSSEMLQLKLGEGSPLKADAERITRASSRASGLTRQLLQFSRRQPLDLSACNANPAAEKAAEAARKKAAGGVTVETRLAADLWAARGQAAGVSQVLEIILANGLEAVGGRGRLEVSSGNVELGESASAEMPEARPGRFVRLTVSDNGPGIKPENRPRLFEPFFSTKGAGRGLGLAAAYGIVKQFGGWISYSDRPGGGAEFSVFLPEHAAEEAAPEAAAPPPPAESPGRGQLVLMVEDEPGIMKVFSAILRMKGYRVAEASGVVRARSLFMQQPEDVSLVFSDVLLPDGNGLDLVQELTARKPGLRVVMTSGFTGDDERLQRIRERGYAFLPKPYNLHTLLETMAAELR